MNLKPCVRRNTFINLNIVTIMTSIAGVTLDYFLHCKQQQRGSTHWYALSVINHGDASDGGDIDEWDWRSMSEDDDQGNGEYCTTSDDDELVTQLLL